MSNNESNKSENNKDIEQEEDIDWILNQPIDMRIIPISNVGGNDDSPRRSINLDSLERNVSNKGRFKWLAILLVGLITVGTVSKIREIVEESADFFIGTSDINQIRSIANNCVREGNCDRKINLRMLSTLCIKGKDRSFSIQKEFWDYSLKIARERYLRGDFEKDELYTGRRQKEFTEKELKEKRNKKWDDLKKALKESKKTENRLKDNWDLCSALINYVTGKVNKPTEKKVEEKKEDEK